MQTSLIRSSGLFFALQSLFWCFPADAVYAGDTPSVSGTVVYFINLEDGQKYKSPFLIQFGLTSEMGIAPALADWPDTDNEDCWPLNPLAHPEAEQGHK